MGYSRILCPSRAEVTGRLFFECILIRLFCNLVRPSATNHSFRVPKTHFPQPHQNQRAVRIQFQSMAPAAFRFEYGHHGLGKLRTMSLTGGLLRLS